MPTTINKKDLIDIRDHNADDKSFIFATWLRGLKFGNSWFNLIDQKAYYSIYHQLIDTVLSKPGTDIKVAVLKDDPTFILGYSVLRADQTILDFVFVKSVWRKIGIANMLVPKTVTTVTSMTKVGEAIFKGRDNLIFNPFI